MSETNRTEPFTPAELVAIIDGATREVFDTMLGVPIHAGTMHLETEVAAAPSSGLVSIIGLAGAWSGTGCVACTGPLACRIASHFLAAEVDAVNEDVLDAIGEITNMIIGNVKTALEERFGPMGLSTPTVISGRDFHTRSARVHEWTVVPFSCENERFYVQFCIAPSAGASRGTLRPGWQIPNALHF